MEIEFTPNNNFKELWYGYGVCEETEVAKFKKILIEVIKELNLNEEINVLEIIDEKPPKVWPIKNEGELKQRKFILDIPPERFDKPLLRHELMHIKDILTPEFNFSIEKSSSLVIKEAMLLWNIFIDSRLWETKKGSSKTKENRRQEFKQQFGNDSHFDEIWNRRDFTSDSIIQYSCELAPTYKKPVETKK